MTLRDYIEEQLKSQEKVLSRSLQLTQAAQRQLPTVDIDSAEFTVTLASLWEKEGEKSLTRNYVGTLEHAVKSAEAEFRQMNARSDIQAQYRVTLNLGEVQVQIPELLFEDFMQRYT